MKKVNHRRISRPVTPSRWVAFRVLQGFGQTDRFVEDLLADEWKTRKLSAEDRRLSHQLVYGTLRNLYRLDFWIDALSSKGIASLPAAIVDILRLGLYQLAFLERVPAHAVVDEAVRLCEGISLGPLKGLVNAILRRFPSQRERLDREIARAPHRISIETSHPDWLVEWAMDTFGEALAVRGLRENNEPAPIYLSLLKSRLSPEDRSSGRDLERESIERVLEEIPGATLVQGGEMLRLPSGVAVGDLRVIREGLAYVQDPGARQAVRLLSPQPGETVFDLCAAPGGKTLQIADSMRSEGTLVAVDASMRRLETVRENLDRCGFGWVEIQQQDLTHPRKEWERTADAVLVDVPCSGLGTLRRKVDLRYRIGMEDIETLSRKAGKILETAARLVCPGGRLVFSTCTLTDRENREVIEKFLSRHPGGWKKTDEFRGPGWLYGRRGSGDESDSDGSYCARLEKA